MSHKTKGVTFVELVLSIVIISVALTGTLMAFNVAVGYSSDPMIINQATYIAKSYVSEIMKKSFPISTPCGSPPGGGRSVYSNVCDYHGLSDTGAKNQNNVAISGLENYDVTVSVDTTTAVLGSLTSGTEVVRFDVTVNHPRIQGIIISGYKTLY